MEKILCMIEIIVCLVFQIYSREILVVLIIYDMN